MLDSQGRIRLPKEFIEQYAIERGDEISFAYSTEEHGCASCYLHQMYCTDDRPNNVFEIVGASAIVGEKNRITIPRAIRKMYTEEAFFVEKDGRFYIAFHKLKSDLKSE